MARTSYYHLMRADPAEVERDNPPENQGDISGWKHISKLHSCQHCDRIVIKHRQVKRLLVSLPHTKSEVLQAEADGCPVFRMLTGSWHLIARDGGPDDLLKPFRFLSDMDEIRDCDSLLGTPAESTKLSAKNQARLKKIAVLLRKTQIVLDNLHRRRFHLFVSCQSLYFLYGITTIRCDGQLKILDGSEGAIDAGGNLSYQALIRKHNTEKVYANTKTFLSLCENSHGACQLFSTVSFVPSRLLRVSPDSGPDYIRLIETRSDGQWTWACLSYVWGGNQRHKTTRSVLPEYLKDICLDVLPQTIKDAVSVCRELGIPYLWIDSFCIVQDDELDKTREIPQMSLIYRHALLTIGAACARNVEDGFLHHVPPLCYRLFAPTSIRFRDRRGRESRPFVLTEKLGSATYHHPNEPIDSRAWTLQEQLLSPRCLSYSSHGLVWSCRSLLQYVNDSVSRPQFISEHRGSGQNIDVVPCIPGQKMLPWEDIVQLYSPRQVTLCSDKLVALSAVAQTYSENFKQPDTYLAGIWRKSMPLSLLWQVPTEARRPRPPEHTAPSWSWASVGGPVQYEDSTWKIDRDCKVIDAQIRTVNRNVFGAVSGGELIMDAKVREYDTWAGGSQTKRSILPYVRDFLWGTIGFGPDTTEFCTSLDNEAIHVTLLIVSHDGSDGRRGLVLLKNTDSESFTRVSWFVAESRYTEVEMQWEYDQFLKEFKVKRVTIV